MQATQPAARPALWKSGLILWAAGVIGVVAVLPYVMALQREALLEAVAATGIPLGVLLSLEVVEGAVVTAIAVFAGLWAARRVGLETPIVDALASGRAIPWKPRATALAAAAGAAASLIVLALDVWVFGGLAGSGASPGDLAAAEAARPGPLAGLLASLYGGITEELQLRLFLLSLLALGLHAAATRGRPASRPLAGWAFWTANIAVAVVFGLGHLPATAALVPLTGVIVLRAIVLNGLLGLVCGVLFRRIGLEWAILAHFTADLVLHVVTPLLTA